MIKKFLVDTVKETAVNYLTTTLLAVTLIGGVWFGISYYIDSKKEAIVKSVKTTASESYHLVVDNNITDQVKASASDAYLKVSNMIHFKKDEE